MRALACAVLIVFNALNALTVSAAPVVTGMTFGAWSLDPPFDPQTFAYELRVPNNLNALPVTVTFTSSDILAADVDRGTAATAVALVNGVTTLMRALTVPSTVRVSVTDTNGFAGLYTITLAPGCVRTSGTKSVSCPAKRPFMVATGADCGESTITGMTTAPTTWSASCLSGAASASALCCDPTTFVGPDGNRKAVPQCEWESATTFADSYECSSPEALPIQAGAVCAAGSSFYQIDLRPGYKRQSGWHWTGKPKAEWVSATQMCCPGNRQNVHSVSAADPAALSTDAEVDPYTARKGPVATARAPTTATAPGVFDSCYVLNGNGSSRSCLHSTDIVVSGSGGSVTPDHGTNPIQGSSLSAWNSWQIRSFGSQPYLTIMCCAVFPPYA